VTDEVMPFVHPSALYPLVSFIIDDVLARHRPRSQVVTRKIPKLFG